MFGGVKSLRLGVINPYVMGLYFLRSGVVLLMFGGCKFVCLGFVSFRSGVISLRLVVVSLRPGVVSLRLGVVFLRSGVINPYVQGLYFLRAGMLNLYSRGL